jgi:pimeloyl-[acyl-carrier protein] methyl ester esterase
MPDPKTPELLLLHALPLDGTMWASQMGLLPGSTYAPTLYALGETLEEWAVAALKLVKSDRLIVVGCSVGGSCAIEAAVAAPDRVVSLVLVGTKADHRPEPDLHGATLQTLREKGLDEAWRLYWAPLFSTSADHQVIAKARRTALAQSPAAIARGVTAFHRRRSRLGFLSGFAKPTVFVTGAEDTAPGPKISRAQSDAALQGSLHIVGACGHYVPLERPTDLNAILRKVVAAQYDR